MTERCVAQVTEDTAITFWFSRNTGISAMQDKPVMGVFLEAIGHGLKQCIFNSKYIFSNGNPGAIGNPENMGVNGNGGLPKGGVQDYVGGFAAHPG